MLLNMRNLYLTRRIFWLFSGNMLVFLLAFAFGWVLPLAKTLLLLSFVVVGLDIFLLFNKQVAVSAKRKIGKLLSLSDANAVAIDIENNSNLSLQLIIIDELPFQLQERNFEVPISLAANQATTYEYDITPTERGEYQFGHINIYAATPLGLVQRRFIAGEAQIVPVYPSVLQMRQYELRTVQQIAHQQGIKKVRRLGHSYEFEQIKNYVAGDDFRSINWKASSRRAELMVNQYEDERSQQVYCIIDKSRVMRMPFNKLTLMDYAINASLTLSNIILKKQDRVGLMTFSNVIGTSIAADRTPNQLNKILEALYKEQQRPVEANYELLYYGVRKFIARRSLLLLFTNFESHFALERVLPILRKINATHLLVVVFFENTAIQAFADQEPDTTAAIYTQTIAKKFMNEKVQIVQKLRQYGIQSILTRPEDLSMNAINKYLELKANGRI
jgi:uncharacterized protein (DUF58 family)